MIAENSTLTPREWAEKHFQGAELSDVRRVDRAITIAEAMAASPGASLPQMFANTRDLKATYTFLRNEEATPDNLQSGHRDLVLCEMATPGRYLLLEDTSEVLCNPNGEIEGLGPVGGSKNGQIGFLLHTVLAVRWPSQPDRPAPQRPTVEILGVADQQYHVRKPREKAEGEKGSLRRKLPGEQLESYLWERSSQRLGPAPDRDDVFWIKVGDRGADIYDHMVECQRLRHHFVIRASQDRALENSAGKREGKLFETVRETARCGKVELELRARPGQEARTARLEISFTSVRLSSPQCVGHRPGSRAPIACTAVRVWEPEPPAGVKALEWVLLTDLKVDDFLSAAEIAQMYATRWLEEEFHKALKTGTDAEAMKLKKAEPWFAAIAIKSIVALRLIVFRERLRLLPDAPASESGLTELELQVLGFRYGKPIRSVSDVGLAIGRLGGHLNRKSDGPPGWITLWRGWLVLQALVEGVLIARKLT